MRPALGLFLLRYRWLIASLLLALVVAYLIGGWWNVASVLLIVFFSAAVALGVMLLFGWL